jgi:hypothetical protein
VRKRAGRSKNRKCSSIFSPREKRHFREGQVSSSSLALPIQEEILRQFAILNAKIGRGLCKILRFNGRFGVGNFGDFSINFAAARKKHH